MSSSDSRSARAFPPRRAGSEVRETIELAVAAWVCCLAIVAALAIPLLGLKQAALIAAGSLVGLVAVGFAISGVHLPGRRRR